MTVKLGNDHGFYNLTEHYGNTIQVTAPSTPHQASPYGNNDVGFGRDQVIDAGKGFDFGQLDDSPNTQITPINGTLEIQEVTTYSKPKPPGILQNFEVVLSENNGAYVLQNHDGTYKHIDPRVSDEEVNLGPVDTKMTLKLGDFTPRTTNFGSGFDVVKIEGNHIDNSLISKFKYGRDEEGKPLKLKQNIHANVWYEVSETDGKTITFGPKEAVGKAGEKRPTFTIKNAEVVMVPGKKGGSLYYVFDEDKKTDGKKSQYQLHKFPQGSFAAEQAEAAYRIGQLGQTQQVDGHGKRRIDLSKYGPNHYVFGKGFSEVEFVTPRYSNGFNVSFSHKPNEDGGAAEIPLTKRGVDYEVSKIEGDTITIAPKPDQDGKNWAPTYTFKGVNVLTTPNDNRYVLDTDSNKYQEFLSKDGQFGKGLDAAKAAKKKAEKPSK